MTNQKLAEFNGVCPEPDEAADQRAIAGVNAMGGTEEDIIDWGEAVERLFGVVGDELDDLAMCIVAIGQELTGHEQHGRSLSRDKGTGGAFGVLPPIHRLQ